jgi:hypothetical protein
MNRAQRRAGQRTRKIVDVTEFRVPAGHAALTFDLAGADPQTLSIDASKLADIVAHTARLVGDWPYQRTLDGLSALYYSCASGETAEPDGLLVGFWLALNHPIGGADMRRMVSNRIAASKPVHITMHGARDGGLGFVLADTYVDVSAIAEAVKAEGIGVVVVQHDVASRQGGLH